MHWRILHTFENEEVVFSSERQHFPSPLERCGHSCRVASVLKMWWLVLSYRILASGHTGTV